MYASAALGVVHDLTTNQQTMFAGHDDDITCIALSNRGALVATGQTGKNPVVHIWNTAPTPRRSKDAKQDNSAAGKAYCMFVHFFWTLTVSHHNPLIDVT